MEKNQIDKLMENLARDLAELENLNTDEKVVESITETYQNIYNELVEIKRL